MPPGKHSILIIDDSEFITTRVIELLSGVENVDQIHSAASYEEGVAAFNTIKPSLVLLDINLPDKNGIEFLRYLKASDQTPDVIMLTNQSDSYYRNLCRKLGAKEFIDKSKDFERLPEIISALVLQ
jgi:DNA-binding NarL/FixJ family response regulator